MRQDVPKPELDNTQPGGRTIPDPTPPLRHNHTQLDGAAYLSQTSQRQDGTDQDHAAGHTASKPDPCGCTRLCLALPCGMTGLFVTLRRDKPVPTWRQYVTRLNYSTPCGCTQQNNALRSDPCGKSAQFQAEPAPAAVHDSTPPCGYPAHRLY